MAKYCFTLEVEGIVVPQFHVYIHHRGLSQHYWKGCRLILALKGLLFMNRVSVLTSSNSNGQSVPGIYSCLSVVVK